MKTVTFVVSGLTCPSCSSHLEGLLKRQKGVSNVRLLFTLSRLKIEYDETLIDSSSLLKRIEHAGYRARQGVAS